MKILQTFGIGKTPSQTTDTFAAPRQRVTILDGTNKQFLRTIVLSNDGVRVSRGTTSAGIAMADLFSALATLEPSLTWAPVIDTQPTNQFIAALGSVTFTVVDTSEIDETYQWQVSSDGVSYSNLTNAGSYSNVTTATLSINNVTGLGGKYYRCVVTNAVGSTNTSAARLTVVNAVPDHTVAAPAVTSFAVTVTGPGSFTYQWEKSSDGGSTWSSVANSGVYSGATLATLSISDSTGLNSYQYRVEVSNGTTTVRSNVGHLTVT